MQRLWPLCAALAIAACTAQSQEKNEAATSPTKADVPDRQLRLIGGGLAVGTRGLHSSEQIDFGAPRERVVAAVTALRGAPTATGRNADCPSGPVEMVSFGALDLHFEEGRFAGWVLDGPTDPPIREEYGLGIGSPRSEIMEMVPGEVTFRTSTLGPEFDEAGLSGLLDGEGPEARVTVLFSGVTCFAR